MKLSIVRSLALTTLVAGAALSTGCAVPTATEGDDAESSSAALSACYGSVSAKYAALGGANSFLGQPTGPETAAPDGYGRFRGYQNGGIYWTPNACAWSVTGGIYGEWSALGWERSVLGYPISDEVNAPDDYGRVSQFQHGSIYWAPGTGAFALYGVARDRWLAIGGVTGGLGYPTSDYVVGGVQAGIYGTQTFEHGAIFVTSTTDAAKTYGVYGLIGRYYDSLGGPYGQLGKPTSQEVSCSISLGISFPTAGRCQSFAHGRLSWSASTGVHYYPG